MLTINDYTNLHNLLRRATFNGLEEAEVGVVLSHKLKAAAQLLQIPPPANAVPTPDEEEDD